MAIFREFPNSANDPFIKTSEVTPIYNCIAWAANDNSRWYEPDPMGIYYWPSDVPREYTIKAYVQLYELLGYKKCSNGEFESNFEKVAVFAKKNIPTHAAKQLSNGSWSSKLGKHIDVTHSLFAMENGQYGNVVQFLRRSLSA